MTLSNSTTAIVIGAGLSGLAAATELLARNIPVKILEASDRVADPWRARNPKLRLNIHRHFARLQGHHDPRHPDTYLPRDAVVDYLSDYALDWHPISNLRPASSRFTVLMAAGRSRPTKAPIPVTV